MTVTAKTVLRFLSEKDAACAAAILSEMPGFDDIAIVLRENAGTWLVECYDGGIGAGGIATGILHNAGIDVVSEEIEAIPNTDWVVETQKGLAPVHVGRFAVHGSHDRHRSVSQWAIEIDAGRAFGTAHHETTKGCLLALDRLARRIHPAAILDLGTGSGVLAIAAAKAFSRRVRVSAVDLDPVAIEVATENCKKNGVRPNVRLFAGDGLKPSTAYEMAPFGVVIANILARPLLQLAPRLRSLTRPGGMLILSGLLQEQSREVLGRYRSTGFRLVGRAVLEGWTTFLLRRAL
jgi:ribosomal protein L11 methyltransferase